METVHSPNSTAFDTYRFTAKLSCLQVLVKPKTHGHIQMHLSKHTTIHTQLFFKWTGNKDNNDDDDDEFLNCISFGKYFKIFWILFCIKRLTNFNLPRICDSYTRAVLFKQREYKKITKTLRKPLTGSKVFDCRQSSFRSSNEYCRVTFSINFGARVTPHITNHVSVVCTVVNILAVADRVNCWLLEKHLNLYSLC